MRVRKVASKVKHNKRLAQSKNVVIGRLHKGLYKQTKRAEFASKYV